MASRFTGSPCRSRQQCSSGESCWFPLPVSRSATPLQYICFLPLHQCVLSAIVLVHQCVLSTIVLVHQCVLSAIVLVHQCVLSAIVLVGLYDFPSSVKKMTGASPMARGNLNPQLSGLEGVPIPPEWLACGFSFISQRTWESTEYNLMHISFRVFKTNCIILLLLNFSLDKGQHQWQLTGRLMRDMWSFLQCKHLKVWKGNFPI